MRNDRNLILHIITGLNDGGAEAVLYRLCTADKNNTHKVVSLMSEGKYGPLLRDSGIEVFSLNMPQGKVTMQGIWQLYKLLRKYQSAIVQTWMNHANLIGGISAYLAGIRNICWGIHQTYLHPQQTRRSTILVAKLCAQLSKWIPKKIICCADSSARVHNDLGYYTKKLIVIYNGYDLIKFSSNSIKKNKLRTQWHTENKVLLGIVGRFDPLKDHKNLLMALSDIKSRDIDFTCVFVGTNLNKNNQLLMQWIAELDLHNHVVLLGQRNDIPDVMNALDIHILCSISEAFPNVLAEAMACGTPCITTDVGDASVIVGDTGWVVLPSDSTQLANAIIEACHAIENTDAWQERCATARKRIEDKFSLESMVASYDVTWNSIR